MAEAFDIEHAVGERYSRGACEPEADLCCQVDYDPRYLEAIPQAVLERDYGCGDPTPHLTKGDRVLDLGSGAGKLCFIASQIVEAAGHVAGIDINGEMLSLARRYSAEVARRVGYANVEFRRGKIDDLMTDYDALDAYLHEHPVASADALADFNSFVEHQRHTAPLIADASFDVVVSNCVLNLVRDSAKRQVFGEVYRVLRRGGRAVISDIVSDEPVPDRLKADPELWSGCVSGALEQSEFLKGFEEAGFHGIEIIKRDDAPWRTVEGIEFRSITVRAYKGKEGPCLDRSQAVIYRGPWRRVEDDDGHALIRGFPMAVCEKTFRIYTSEPYAADVIPVPPLTSVASDEARSFDCSRPAVRHPRETKGLEYMATTDGAGGCCGPDGCR